MRKVEYRITISNDSNVEQILSEIDNYFIKLEHKYANVQVET
jgi:hypothetical protein